MPGSYVGAGRRNQRGPDPYSFFSLQSFIRHLSSIGYTIDQIVDYIIYGRVPGTSDRPDRPDRPDPSPDRPDPRPAKPDLEVKSVDLQVAANTKAHHTDEYDIAEASDPFLVVRRGQAFSLKFRLSRPFPAKDHDLRLIFETGSDPIESKGTRASFKVSDDGKAEKGKWSARFLQKSGDSVEVSVLPPPRCIVGKWQWTAELLKRGQTKPLSVYRAPKHVYILFNPWCKEDVVYNENEDELQEYVLEETGGIWQGNQWSNRMREWTFGQFTGNVLDCTLDLLDNSDLVIQVRGDPVKVVRKLSGLVNSQDERGVLTGNWGGNYSGGKSPSSWTGSVAILEQYYETKEPVKYGQCWVFSGVLTTVCRALGIPCRSVTNFASAHDTDASVTIDEHYDMNSVSMGNDADSIWNFHVWNEVWMRREDQEAMYNGWQACDATPQEASEGLYQCGPCPVRAIKEGDMRASYDAPFIFAEVNADVVKWKYDAEDAEFKPFDYEKDAVGKKMSTRHLKKYHSEKGKRNDVTSNYKYPEGSSQEEEAKRKAYCQTVPRALYSSPYTAGPKDMKFKLDFDPECPVGEDFVVKFICTNTSNEDRTVHGEGSISTMFYTGVVAHKVSSKKFSAVKVKPNASQEIIFRAGPEQYQEKLTDGCFLKCSLTGIVAETMQSAIKNDNVMLKKPLLKIKAPKEGRVGVEFEVTVTLDNPLNATLTECCLEVEGPGITKSKEYPQGEVAAKGTLLATIKLTPKKKKTRTIVVVFTSKQLDNITESCEILVA